MEHISCGPLTPDLPLGVRGAEGRSPHVVTACVLLTSHWFSPPFLEDAVPPTSYSSFFVSLGKFVNGLSRCPHHYCWSTIISLSAHPQARTVGRYKSSKRNLPWNLYLITGSGLYFLLIINMVAGVLIPRSVSN